MNNLPLTVLVEQFGTLVRAIPKLDPDHLMFPAEKKTREEAAHALKYFKQEKLLKYLRP